MKKQYYLLASAMMLVAGAAQAQGNELFFSEYAEGAHQSGVDYGGGNSVGSERAIEIYNPTTTTVNLNPYSIRRYSNGSTTVTEEEKLFRSNASQVATGANTLNPSSTFVVVCGEATLPGLRAVANQFSVGHAPVTGPTVVVGGGVAYFNGDDAVALVRYPATAGVGTGVIVDLIGVIGERPLLSNGNQGGNWSGTNPIDDIPGTTPTQVFVSSANQTIQRRPNISTGIRTNPLPQQTPGVTPPTRNPGGYNIADEWLMYSTAFNGPIIPPSTTPSSNPGGQLYDRFGDHQDYAGAHAPLSVGLAKFNASISIYPNPAHGTATVDIKDAKVGSVVVLNNLGQRIAGQAKGTGQEQIKLDISGLKAGLYFVQILSADGSLKIYKELVVQ